MYRQISAAPVAPLSALLKAAFAGVGLMVISACAAATLTTAQAIATPERVNITATPVSLFTNRPTDVTAGSLRFISGIELKNDHAYFGGISGLAIDKSGKRFIAITDKGAYLKGLLTERAPGVVTGMRGVKADQLQGLHGPLNKKADADAEALVDLSDGSLTGPFIIAFEGKHRALHYKRLDQTATNALPIPAKGPYIPSNGGLEALVKLQNGQIMGLTEEAKDQTGNHLGWIADGISARALSLKRIGAFKPTDMARLPDGDILVLERSFDRFSGPGMRVRRIAAASIKPGALLDGPVLATLNRSASIDNMEAMATRQTDDGRTLIYIMSDDNFSMAQRTLLLVFELTR